MASKYEIEIKTLLGAKENADALRNKITESGGALVNQNKQLNHYFLLQNADALKNKFSSEFADDDAEAFDKILTEGKNFSVRTREVSGADGALSKVLLVIKASIGDDSSSNGVSRMEFEREMKMSLDELDQMLLSAGLTYQSKWSREREEYTMNDTFVCIDKNAGYGYLAEFEKITEDQTKVPEIKTNLLATMSQFGVVELPQDRLERMFTYYNQNWPEYYGTDKVFTIN